MTCSARPGRGARAPSASSTNDNTVSTMQTSGTSSICGAYWNASWPCSSIDPHSGVGGCMPAPRYERPAPIDTTEAPLSARDREQHRPEVGQDVAADDGEAADARARRRPPRTRAAAARASRRTPARAVQAQYSAVITITMPVMPVPKIDASARPVMAVGIAQEDVGDAHQDLLDPAAVEAGDHADDRAQRRPSEVGDERDLEVCRGRRRPRARACRGPSPSVPSRWPVACRRRAAARPGRARRRASRTGRRTTARAARTPTTSTSTATPSQRVRWTAGRRLALRETQRRS